MPVLIRPAVLADAGNLAEVHVASLRETYGRLVTSEVLASFDVAERAEAWHRTLGDDRDPDHVVVVADDAGTLVGFAWRAPPRHRVPARAWELRSLYTRAAVHGSGVGAALLDAAVGNRPVEVWLVDDNARAAAFYRKHGFADDGTVGFIDRWDLPEHRMVR